MNIVSIIANKTFFFNNKKTQKTDFITILSNYVDFDQI